MVKALLGAAHQPKPGFHGRDTVRYSTDYGTNQVIATVAVFVE